ncbi:MAG: chromate transporter [Tissierellia bacterium]|nr:chromate transporter [Tissierellia bacterium]
MQNKISLWEVFLTFLKISSFTFGGGYTIIPVIKDEFSVKRNLITEDDMMDIIAVGQSGPGAMAINTSILTGYKVKGIKGALAAVVGAVLPCIVIITIVSYFYKEFRDNHTIQTILKAMSGAISAVLLLTTYDLFKNAIKENTLYAYIAMIFAFVSVVFFNVSTSLIILILALSGLILFGLVKKEGVQ